MPSLTIRNIPEKLIQRIREAAAEERRSVNAQVLYWLERAAPEQPTIVGFPHLAGHLIKGVPIGMVCSSSGTRWPSRRSSSSPLSRLVRPVGPSGSTLRASGSPDPAVYAFARVTAHRNIYPAVNPRTDTPYSLRSR